MPTTTTSVTNFQVLHATSGVDDTDTAVIINELEKVTVTGNHVRREGCQARVSAYHVIRLVLVNAHYSDPGEVQDSADHGNLRLKRVRDNLYIRAMRDDLSHPVLTCSWG